MKVLSAMSICLVPPSQAAEKGSVSGTSAGSVTPPPMQDTAVGTNVSSDTTFPAPTSPSLDRTGMGHFPLTSSSSMSSVFVRQLVSSPQMGQQHFRATRRSTTALSPTSESNRTVPSELYSRHSVANFSPSYPPVTTLEATGFDDKVVMTVARIITGCHVRQELQYSSMWASYSKVVSCL